jgi:hypothetical protein
MSEERKSASPSVTEGKNWRKMISIEEKLHIINRPEKAEQIIDICRKVGLAHSSVRTIRDNADRIRESAKSRTKVFV